MIRGIGYSALAFFALLIFSSSAGAQTINAASCNASDVQTAFSAVTSSTTTVIIPSCGAGGVSWTSQVTLSVPSGSTTLTIEGQGVCTPSGTPGASNYTVSCNDASEITDNDTTNQPILLITNISGYFRLTGLTVVAGSGAGSKNNGNVDFNGSSTQIRTDHNHFVDNSSGSNGHLVEYDGCLYGVIDHNLATAQFQSGSENTFRLYNAGGCYSDPLGQGDESWYHATGLGSSSFMFVEDNEFVNGFGDDCSQGGRMVFRYNYFSESGTASGIQTHATGASARWRGCRAWEVYDNYFYPNDNTEGLQPQFYLSAGTGVIWNNTAAGVSSLQGFKGLVVVHNSRNGTDYSVGATPSGWGYCGNAYNGTGSNWDQNSVASTGYRCIDQVGAGQSDLLENDFPNVTNATTGCAATTYTASQTCAWAANALEPVYEWGNYWNNTLGYTGLVEFGGDQPLTQNQDYYLWCNSAATTGCTSAFNGAQGVGSGTYVSIPSTCTTGVAYWATDQNTLYKCTATNRWTAFYTPYTYPHPLDTTTQTSGAPVAPTGLQAALN